MEKPNPWGFPCEGLTKYSAPLTLPQRFGVLVNCFFMSLRQVSDHFLPIVGKALCNTDEPQEYVSLAIFPPVSYNGAKAWQI